MSTGYRRRSEAEYAYPEGTSKPDSRRHAAWPTSWTSPGPVRPCSTGAATEPLTGQRRTHRAGRNQAAQRANDPDTPAAADAGHVDGAGGQDRTRSIR
jgi:hypothetical protein